MRVLLALALWCWALAAAAAPRTDFQARCEDTIGDTLSVLTALFLPPTLVTGLFGMNTKGLPLSDNEDGSTVAIAIAVVSAVAVFLLIRRLGLQEGRERKAS